MDGLGRQADRTVRPHRRTPVSRGRKVGRLCQERDCRNLRILAKAFRTAFQDRSLSNGRLWKKRVFSLPSPIILPISAKPTKGMSTAKTSNTRNSLPCTRAQFGDTLPTVAIEADRCILKNLETGKHNRKKRGLQKRKPPEVSGERQSRVAGLSSVMTERDDLCGFPSLEAGRLYHRKGGSASG